MTTDIRMSVPSSPEPGLLRPAIEAALTGNAWPEGVEAQIGTAVADAVRAATEGGAS